uniref:Uncharacterized protein n=1 Tax=Arundo donax TaxID=35708 RepID=A0A0A9F7B9_ARUDO
MFRDQFRNNIYWDCFQFCNKTQMSNKIRCRSHPKTIKQLVTNLGLQYSLKLEPRWLQCLLDQLITAAISYHNQGLDRR